MIEHRSMKHRPRYPLQPLRISGGWQITLNTFHQLPFTPETLEWFDASVLIGGVHRQGQRCFDCAFLPEDDPGGEFVLSLMTYPQDRSNTVPGQEELLEEFKTRDTAQLIARLEAFMLDTTQQADPDSGHGAIAPLQAIRLPAGWEISHHQLPQAALGADTLPAFNHPLLLAGAGREHGFTLGFESAPKGSANLFCGLSASSATANARPTTAPRRANSGPRTRTGHSTPSSSSPRALNGSWRGPMPASCPPTRSPAHEADCRSLEPGGDAPPGPRSVPAR